MVNRVSTGAMKVLCSREHVLIDFNLSSAPVEPTLRNQSTSAMKVLCSREHVWWTPTSLQHRLNRRFRIKAPVHWMYFVPERLFELISEPLQHRLNRCPYGACTGANDASVDTVSELQRLLLWHRETGWTDAHIFYTVGSSGGHGFSAENLQRLCDLLHSI